MDSSKRLSLAKRVLYTAGYLLLAYALMQLSDLIGIILTYDLEASENEVLRLLAQYVSFIGVWIVFIGFVLLCPGHSAMLAVLGRKRSGNRFLFSLGVGLVLGPGLNLVAGGGALLQKNISLRYVGADPLMLWVFLVAVALQSGGEELVARWFIYENVKKYFPEKPVVPVLVNAMFFMTLHLTNAGVSLLSLVNLVLAGILYSLLVYRFHSFWAAAAAHTGWNFCQNIILGLPNSGRASTFSVFSLDTGYVTGGFAYDPAFGIEGSLMATLLFAGASLVVFLHGRKRKT